MIIHHLRNTSFHWNKHLQTCRVQKHRRQVNHDQIYQMSLLFCSFNWLGNPLSLPQSRVNPATKKHSTSLFPGLMSRGWTQQWTFGSQKNPFPTGLLKYRNTQKCTGHFLLENQRYSVFPQTQRKKDLREMLVGGWALPLWKMMEWKSVGITTFPTVSGKNH